uniref:Fibrinogen C-terminal domain-containing protein n=1 Tax=Branchiostoma floridae TaxID=7739 RepID=C3ZQ37_BRAFL|eukprot:XP_002589405.1 hypothetical protein BRAFLDRAFT_77847 [Branchiostoma floridae]
MKTRSKDTKTKAPIQKKIMASTSKEDFPVHLAGRDRAENSAEAPALSGGGGTMHESPHPPNEASVPINPQPNLTYEHMYNPWPSDPMRAQYASNPVYGYDLKGMDPDTDLRPASMEPDAVRNQEEDADDNIDHQPAMMEPYAVTYQDKDADDDIDHQPAMMEPYAVKYQEEDDDDDKDHRPASMQPYAVAYQEKDDDDDKDHRPASMEPYAVAYQEKDADDDSSLMEPDAVRNQEEDADDNIDHQPAMMEPYAVKYQEEDDDDDKDHRPASMQPYAVAYQEKDDDDDKDHRPASMEPYAVAYQEKDADDDSSLSHERGAACTSGNNAGTSGNDAGTSVPRSNDRSRRGTRKPRHAQGVPHGPREAAGGTTPMQQTDWQARADAAASIPNPMYAPGADRTYPGGASGRCALCSFIRSQLIYMAAGIAVLLSLVAMVFALLAFINNGGISELSTTVDSLKSNQDNTSTAVDALKCDQDDMRQLSTTVDALKRNQDNMSAFVDALKLDLDKERNRTAALEQRLYKLPEYSTFRVSGESDGYRLHISGYSGTAGDAMADRHYNNGQRFSTVDRDNDDWYSHCSQQFGQGGWWYRDCGASFLNGRYLGNCGNSCADRQGVVWYHWRGSYSLKSVSMKIRP